MRSLARVWIGVACLAGVATARPAAGFEFFDGRLQVHGFAEAQIRTLARDMKGSDNWDLAQWYSVLSLEMEYMAVDSGWGPFDLLSFFGRVEARYDCVWTRACGMFPSVNAWGDRASHLPMRMTDARRSGFQGSVFVGPTDRYSGTQLVPQLDERTASVGFPQFVATSVPQDEHRPLSFGQLHRIDGLFEVAGPDERYGTPDDPAPFAFAEILSRCHFGSRELRGGDNGRGVQIMGPIEPGCPVRTLGRLADIPNPFNALDLNPVLFGLDRIPNTADDASAPLPPVGSAELPFRPAPTVAAAGGGPASIARGIYYPSPALRKAIDDDIFDSFDQNFRQAELEWNRGASQQDERELKELYADMEFFDSRLWVRAGKQNIVWGKTELFRTTDQFNPADLALATLPDLEEARIPLWSIRGVYSFYSLGPLEDVRLELAANLDDFEPSDIGRCGEPFTVFAACNKTTGLFFHGVTGFGVAGEHRPPNPWSNASGVEYGARLEFRYGRFSFQISDFFGYEDLPYADRLSDYSRNVDPFSGRPRRAGASSPCTTGREPACLGLAPASGITPDGTALNLSPENRQAVLDATPVNLQLFTMICSTSIGFNSIDPTACGQSVFNSLANLLTSVKYERSAAKNPGEIPISSTLSNGLAGNTSAANILRTLTGTPIPFVRLNADPCDAFRTDGCPAKGQAPVADFGPHPTFQRTLTLNGALTDEQEALLGCGAFYGSDCEVDGVDFANTEASVFMESLVGSPGTISATGWTTLNGFAQPGTVGFDGGPAGTRYVPGMGAVPLPGARAPGEAGYDPLVDGTTAGLVIPAAFGASAGQQLRTEMAAVSFNFQLLAAALSSPPDADGDLSPDGPSEPDEFDPTDPYSIDPGQCSWAQPQFCGVIKSFFTVVGQERNAVRAGGRGNFGRTDFLWHSGGEVVLRYEKRNVLGFSTDFAEDFTKSNWSIESAWIEGQRFSDMNELDGVSQADTFNLTISVDRPTFINFMNPQRTFFINSQLFFQYVAGYNRGFTTNGPWNMLATLTVNTGYFRDRLQPAVTFIYDQQSGSGGVLPKITYRFTSNFSATIGVNWFLGKTELRDNPLLPVSSVDTQVGKDAYHQGVENALAVVRDRDEVFFRLRYTW
jgi:hypothetical protein